MKFVFTESFHISEWNGEIARTTKGISGSHTAAMYLAEALVLQNQEVLFVSMRNQMVPGKYKGVEYQNIRDFASSAGEECDFLVTTHNLNDLQILSHVTVKQKIIFIMHNELYNDDPHSPNTFAPLSTIQSFQVICAFISETSKRLIINLQPFLNHYQHISLPNSLDIEELCPYRLEDKQDWFVFFANRDRGYEMCRRILSFFPDYGLLTSHYSHKEQPIYLESSQPSDKPVLYSPSNAKNSLYKTLSKAKYFVYPLIQWSDNPYTNHYIHYDTFGYVILEALCHGVIVITPRMAVYEELFGDALCYVDTEGVVESEYLREWRKHNGNFGEPLIPRYVQKIQELDAQPELRRQYIQRGIQMAHRYAHQNIANRLMRILDERKQNDLRYHLRMMSIHSEIPYAHVQYLQNLKNNGFEPNVIYDIGACVGAWSKVAKGLWPNARILLFEANGEMEFLYCEAGWEYVMGLLGKEDGQWVKYYQNDFQPTGNSYYREIGCEHGDYHPENQYLWKPVTTLDTIIQQKGFPLPDLVKMDVQGAEWDIFLGAKNTLKNVQHLIMELQHTEYNQGALKNTEIIPKMDEFGWKCVAPLFCNNGPDGDYDFNPIP